MGLIAQMIMANYMQDLRQQEMQRQMQQRQSALSSILGAPGTPATFDPMAPGTELAPAQPGTGLLGNWQDPQARIQAAYGLMGVPGLESVGGSLLQNLRNNLGQDERERWRLAQQESQYGRSLGEQQRQFGIQEDRRTLDSAARRAASYASAQSSMASAARTQQATGFDAINQQRQALQWAREDAATRDPSGRYVGPAPGAGKQRVFIPRGQPDPMSGAQAYDQAIVPSVGTGDWNTAYDELQQARDPIELIDQMGGLLERYGTEGWGPISARYGNIREELLAYIADRQNKGVLQDAEAERLQSILPDPGETLSMTQLDTIRAAWMQQRQFAEDELAERQQKYALLPGIRMERLLAPVAPTQLDVPAPGAPAAGPRSAGPVGPVVDIGRTTEGGGFVPVQEAAAATIDARDRARRRANVRWEQR
jgi:hypothetical protein